MRKHLLDEIYFFSDGMRGDLFLYQLINKVLLIVILINWGRLLTTAGISRNSAAVMWSGIMINSSNSFRQIHDGGHYPHQPAKFNYIH